LDLATQIDITTRQDAEALTLRKPRASEIGAVRALFEDEVRAGRMLPRAPYEIRNRRDDWLVVAEDERVLGCVSLVFYGKGLCELRSLAVDPEQRGRGLGLMLIRGAVELARERGMRRVLTLTRAVPLFEQAGFCRDFVANFPEKVWRDCRPCPFRHRCDEVALIYDLDRPIGSDNGKDCKNDD
jgi:N-acetylglutamate synthase-like GNAT family acetyltransferase